MAYIATESERWHFEELHHELRSVIDLYQNRCGIKFVVPWNTWMPIADEATGEYDRDRVDYYDFRVQKKLGPFKRTILTISPPYSVVDVSVLNSKFHDLGEQVKEEIAKFWRWGKKYRYKGEEEIEYKLSIFAKYIHALERGYESSSDEYVEDDLDCTLDGLGTKTKEEEQEYLEGLERAAIEVQRERLKELAESKN